MTYRAGYDVAAAGAPVSACPWKPTAPEAKDWLEGWTQGAGDRLHATGGYGATLQEKAEARLPAVPSVCGRGVGDDVHNLWKPVVGLHGAVAGVATVRLFSGPDDTVGTALPVKSFTWGAPVNDTCHDLWTAPTSGMYTFEATLTPAGVKAFGILDHLSIDPAPDPKARALARKRRPFVCHRHGATSGGFCRTCTRRR